MEKWKVEIGRKREEERGKKYKHLEVNPNVESHMARFLRGKANTLVYSS